MVFDLRTSFIKPQFHAVHDDEFQIFTPNSNNFIPPNYQSVFDTQHHADDPSFSTPLEATNDVDSTQVRISMTSNDSAAPSEQAPSNDSTVIANTEEVFDSSKDAIDSPEEDNVGAVYSASRDGSFSQNTRHGRIVIKPARATTSAILRLTSVQSCTQANSVKSTNHVPSIFKAQTAYDTSVNILQDNACNRLHPLSHLASTANDNVLYYHEAIKVEDSFLIRDTVATEIQNFKSNSILKLIKLKDNPKEKSLLSFV